MGHIKAWLKSPNSRLPLAIVLFGVAAVALLWIEIFYWGEREKREALAETQRSATNFAIAFREEVLRTITAIDQTMVVLKAEYENDPDHFRLPDWLDGSPALSGTTVQVGIIGADGRLLMSNVGQADKDIDLSDRAHFRYHLSPDAPQPYISEPVVGRVSGKQSIQVTRRLERADGSFAGVLVVSLDPTYLARFFDTVDLGSQGIVLLIGRDGVVRARRSRTQSAGGANLSDSRLLAALSKADQGGFRARSPLDGVERIKSFSAIPGYPLAVMVGLGVDEGMRSARAELRVQMLQGAIVSLVISGLIALVLRQLARREEAEARLRQAHKMESIGQLTAGIAHDFNNMLTAIAGNLERIQGIRNDPERMRFFKNIHRTIDHGTRLVHHLLAFARKQHLKLQPLDINRLIENFLELLRITCGSKVHIDLKLEPNLWLAMADANQVETAILNVALNAHDAMPTGGRLIIKTANLRSGNPRRPRDLDPGDFVSITMRDTGTGMTEEVLAKAFDPFFTTKEFGRGSGMGLSQVYGNAKQSGGTVEIDSAPGRGTSVRIYLPRAAAWGFDRSRQLELSDAGYTRRAAILVVDDDPLVREFVIVSLTEAGYSPVEAADGHAALRSLEAEPVDLAIIDLTMPDMPGTEVARLARLSRPQLRVLFITGYVDPELTAMVGDEPLLMKPFRAEVLKAEVAKILAGCTAGVGADDRRRLTSQGAS